MQDSFLHPIIAKIDMNIEELRDFCLSLPATTEGFPFDNETLVFKVHKMFALAALESAPLRVNLKCDPDRAIALREEHPAIIEGYHMNKKHWNTLVLDGSLSDELVQELILHSYRLVVQSLPKKLQDQIKLP